MVALRLVSNMSSFLLWSKENINMVQQWCDLCWMKRLSHLNCFCFMQEKIWSHMAKMLLYITCRLFFFLTTEIANEILYPASSLVEKKGILEQKIFIENALKSWDFETQKYSNGRRLSILYVCILLLLWKLGTSYCTQTRLFRQLFFMMWSICEKKKGTASEWCL